MSGEMVAPDKQVARPLGESSAEREAKAAHVANLAGGTFVLGGLAALIGLAIVGIALSAAHQMAGKGTLPEDAWVVFLLPGIGAVFIAYAIWAAMQVFWVGGDEDNDERLWARLSSEQRGRWRLRDAARNVWGWRLLTGISLAALLYLDLLLSRLLAQAALAGRWEPASAAAAFTAVTACLALLAFRTSYRPPEAAGVMVSQGRWVFPVPRDSTLLEIVRESDRPLVLDCTLTLPSTDVARGRWTAKLEAYRLWSNSYVMRSAYGRWLDVEAAGKVEKSASRVHFTLRARIPDELEHRMSIWAINIENPGGAHKPIEIILGKDIVFPEEYPA